MSTKENIIQPGKLETRTKIITTKISMKRSRIPRKYRIETLSKPIITLGISVIEITDDLSKQNDLPKGLYVQDVTDFSSAQKAGIYPILPKTSINVFVDTLASEIR